MDNGSIHQSGIIVNIYPANIGAPKYIKQILTNLKGKINNTVMVGNFNTSLSTMDGLPTQNQQENIALKLHLGSNRPN